MSVYRIPECANTPYRPSCGTEGLDFQEEFCEHCKHDAAYRADPNCEADKDGIKGCRILADAIFYQQNDPRYPKEWVHNDKGEPICTAFEEKKP